jgi:hypothetical protein
MTNRERDDKIKELKKQIAKDEALIQEKHKSIDERYREVQDFTKADYYATERAMSAITSMKGDIGRLEGYNRKRRNKIKDLEDTKTTTRA